MENNTAATVTINSKSYAINPDGTVDIDTSKFAAGEYRVTASIAENAKYFANQTTVTFKITKYNSTVKASAKDINYRDDEIITVTVPEEQTGFVNIFVNNKTYSGKIRNGQATINITGLEAGEYNVTVNYEGDDKYFESSNVTSFKVSKTDLVIGTDSNATANVVGQDVTNKENATFIVSVPQDFNGKINITVDNETYSGDADSVIKMAPLTSGNKNATVTLWNDSNYNDVTFNVPFKVSNVTEAANITTIKADNLTRGYNSQYDFQATFLDGDGKALADTNVKFVINGETYTVKTNKDGIAQLTASKLDVGTYNVTSINTATGESTVNELNIVKRIIKNKDMTIDFLSGKYYVVQVIGDDGKPVGEGEIVDIYANTIHYVAKTDKDGYARLKINLNPKKYTFYAEYKSYKTNNNKVVVKQTLKLVKKTVKVKKGKKIVLKAKLKWSSGKAIKGKKIVFKFKGKKYSAKTNKKGIAKVTIKKKSVLKKLKKGKTYKFTAAYKTNKVKGKVKIKK